MGGNPYEPHVEFAPQVVEQVLDFENHEMIIFSRQQLKERRLTIGQNDHGFVVGLLLKLRYPFEPLVNGVQFAFHGTGSSGQFPGVREEESIIVSIHDHD
jgi:hypothetical protein